MSLRRWRLWALVGVLALLSVLPRVGHAAGLYTAPSNPTYNTGPEAAWMNPAGMTGLKSGAVAAGVAGIFTINRTDVEISEAGGDDGGNMGTESVLPSFYLAGPVSDRFSLGLSFFSPLGGVNGTGWDFGDNFAGRFGSQKMTFASTALAGSAAVRLTDEWSLGAGASAQWLSVDYSVAVRTPLPGDGKVEMDGIDDWSARFFAGTQYQVSPTTSVGLVYRSQWDPDLTGTRTTSGPRERFVRDEPFEFGLHLPQEVEAGIQHAFSKTWILGATFGWQDWSVFENIFVETPLATGGTVSRSFDIKWHDTYSGGLSVTHIRGATFYNVGVAYSSSPVSDDDRIILLPVDESLSLSLGVQHNASETLTFSLGGAAAFSGDAEVDENLQGLRYKGNFDTNVAIVLGGSMQWRF